MSRGVLCVTRFRCISFFDSAPVCFQQWDHNTAYPFLVFGHRVLRASPPLLSAGVPHDTSNSGRFFKPWQSTALTAAGRNSERYLPRQRWAGTAACSRTSSCVCGMRRTRRAKREGGVLSGGKRHRGMQSVAFRTGIIKRLC